MLSTRFGLLLLALAAVHAKRRARPGDADGADGDDGDDGGDGGDATFQHADADAMNGDGDAGVNPAMYNTVNGIQYGFIASGQTCHSSTSKCFDNMNLQTCVSTVHADVDCGFGFSHQPNGGGGKCCCGSAVHNTWCWNRDTTPGASVYCLEGGDAGGDQDMDAEDPTGAPTDAPTRTPDKAVAAFLQQVADGDATNEPTDAPTDAPTLSPTGYPTSHPTAPTTSPTRSPTKSGGTSTPTTPSPTNHHFDPASTLVSYWERGSCGVRGDDAQADLSQCQHGYTVVRSAPAPNGYRTVLTVNDCEYFAYIVYECIACTGDNCNPTNAPQTSSPTNTNSPTTNAPTTTQQNLNGQVENYGLNCWSACGGQGWCTWCGTGLCCRWGWTKGALNGCEGNGIKGMNAHVCVPPIPTAAPSTLAPSKAPTSPTKAPSGSPSTLTPTKPAPTESPTTGAPTTANPTSSPTNLFDPTSTLVTYWDNGNCGPRGDDAQADLSQCEFGAYVERQILAPGSNEHLANHGTGWTVIATYDGCEYFGYIKYTCHTTEAPTSLAPTDGPTGPTNSPSTEAPTMAFDPTSTLVSYWDLGSCGPRGDDAQADLSQCINGAKIVRSYNTEHTDYNAAFTYSGCQYFSYIMYECMDAPTKTPTKNPTANVVGCCVLPDPDQADGGWYIDNVYADKCSREHWQAVAADHIGVPSQAGSVVPMHFAHKACSMVSPTKAPSGAPTTDSPTTAAWANYVGMSGDPFAEFAGKKTQFYLPLGQMHKLMQCRNNNGAAHTVGLWGRTMTSKIQGDVQQWFNMFELNINGVVLKVAISNNKTVSSNAQVSEDQTQVLKAKDRVRATLDKIRKSETQAVSSLTTLNITVETQGVATQVTDTGSLPAIPGAIAAVKQDRAKMIGEGYSEALDVRTVDFGVTILSSMANKFDDKKEQHSFTHLDVMFNQINANHCGGALPEIWGLRPMSIHTSRLLVPPVKE